jgi:uncharacterized protein involved in response to NO
MALIPLEDPRRPLPPHFALWGLGFRPFYLVAAAFAIFAIPLWVLNLHGRVPVPMPGIWWHAHEMIFGFAAAVIVGFLFTAGRNWTGLRTPHGRSLQALVALWAAGRIGLLFSDGGIAATVDFLFLPAAGFALARVLVRAGNRRNYVMLVILSALSVANLAFHLARFGVIAIDPLRALHGALGLVVVLETVMAGRVIPMFTENGLRQSLGLSVSLTRREWLDRAAIGATLAAIVLWIVDAGSWSAAVSALAAVLQLLRTLNWRPWLTRRVPLLWILHAGHLWIPVGLGLLAVVQLQWIPRSAALHAFGIGSTGGLIIGMMTRTALGHTGRMLRVGAVETGAYLLVMAAALTRVLSVAALPAVATAGIHLAATFWVLAFGLYLYRYLPFLVRSRADGMAD